MHVFVIYSGCINVCVCKLLLPTARNGHRVIILTELIGGASADKSGHRGV